jgi:hypothetical protein
MGAPASPIGGKIGKREQERLAEIQVQALDWMRAFTPRLGKAQNQILHQLAIGEAQHRARR